MLPISMDCTPPVQENISISEINSQLHYQASEIVKSFINKLSLNLIQNGNNYNSKVISSTSLSTLAGMIILSMDNNTDKEKMLGLDSGGLTPELEQQIHNELGKYTKEHPFVENCSIGSANFLASVYQLQDEDFNTKLFKLYDTKKCETTYKKNVADAINEFIIQKTNGKITDVFEGLSPTARDNLVFSMGNVITFKGIWENKFDTTYTRTQAFQCSDGKIIENVKMMNMLEETFYASDCGFDIIIKNFQPDGSNTMQFVAIIPQEHSGQTIENLNTDIINHLIEKAQNSPTKKVLISIPKVEIDSTISTLKDDIEAALGVSISAEKLAKLGLEPSDQLGITQKIKASINEEGAEASIVTNMSVSRSISTPPLFLFNRPGYMAIIDGDQKLIEATIENEKFLVTDGAVKYSSSRVTQNNNQLLNYLATNYTPYNKTWLSDTGKAYNFNNYDSNRNLYPESIYRTKEEIEACCKQEPTITKVMKLIPPYSELVIEKYVIQTSTKKVTQYLIKDANKDYSFDNRNHLVIHDNRHTFTDDDCVTAVYSINGKIEFICEDIPTISLMPMPTTTDITALTNEKFNKNGDLAISKAVIDDYEIKISLTNPEAGKKLQQIIQKELGSQYENFVAYYNISNRVDVTFKAADKLKQLLGIDDRTS